MSSEAKRHFPLSLKTTARVEAKEWKGKYLRQKIDKSLLPVEMNAVFRNFSALNCPVFEDTKRASKTLSKYPVLLRML